MGRGADGHDADHWSKDDSGIHALEADAIRVNCNRRKAATLHMLFIKLGGESMNGLAFGGGLVKRRASSGNTGGPQ